MNRAYKLVWNSAQQAWAVASELAKGKTKSSAKSLSVVLAFVAGFATASVQAAPAVDALPSGESVVTGSASFDRSVTNQLTVNQTGSKLLTNWNSFDVGSSAKVIFNQPDAASVALNRVTSGSSTQIFGQVHADGQLVIVNPNGITFGAGSQVSAASIIGSVLDIQDSDFNTGNLLFSRGSATGAIDNQGSLTATAGSVSLLAPSVKNSGAIIATGGDVTLINADTVNISTADPAVSAVSSITSLIKNSGNIQAIQLSSAGGKIKLRGYSSQPDSKAELSGIFNAEESSVIAAQIHVIGVLDVNGINNTLKLSSTAPYNLSFGSKINLNGANSGFSVNGTAYTVIRDVNQLQAMNSNLSGKYVLANDVDASDTVNWNGGAGFASIASNSVFSGILDGLGHAVNGLYVNRPSVDNIGLIGYASNTTIKNIAVTNANVKGSNNVGALVGFIANSAISNSYATGSVVGSQYVGGLVGSNAANGGTASITNSYAESNVTGPFNAGGLLGFNNAINGTSSISNSYATGSVTSATRYVGGLVGQSITDSGGTTVINASYSTANVSGSDHVGGLVGRIRANGGSENISTSYATGLITGTTNVGGLLGVMLVSSGTASVSSSYWDRDTTTRTTAIGGVSGGTSSNLIAVYGNNTTTPSAYAQGSYSNLNFSTQWFMAEGSSRPMLRAFLNTPGSEGKIAISNLYQLQGMAANLAGNYYLTQDIDASVTAASVTAGNASKRSDVWGGRGFAPVGNSTTPFTGKLDGLGHSVNGVRISRSTTDAVALVGYTQGALINNIGLGNINILGQSATGGLVGYALSSTVTNSYATGSVSGAINVGGLVGMNFNSTIDNSYATDSVSGNLNVGGLVGFNSNSIVSNSYASGTVSGGGRLGGLIGNNSATVNNSYWDVSSTGQANASGLNDGGTLTNVAGLTSSQMKNLSSFGNWGGTIDAQGGTGSVWRIYEGQTTPLLRSFLKPITVTVDNASKTYDGAGYSGGNGYSLSNPVAQLLGSVAYGGTSQGARNTGAYTINLLGLYSNQQGYDIRTVNGTLTINKANLSISGSMMSRSYNGTTTATGTASATGGTVLYGGDFLNGGIFTFDNKNVGTGKTVTVSGVTVNDGNSGNNYNVTYVPATSGTITKADLIISTANVIKTYDGTTAASGTAVATSGTQLFAGDSLTGGTFAFDTKNAGGGKTVSISAVSVDDGNSGNNYDVSYADNTNSTINKAALVLSSTDVTKTYDGTTAAAGTVVVNSGSLLGGDTISGGSFVFDSKHAGTGKTVSTSGVTVDDGNGGNNYDVIYADNNSSTINKASLVISTTDVNKTYNGTTSAIGSVIASAGTQLFDADSLTGGTFAFDNRHAGTGKTVSVSAVTVNDGNSGNNYNVSYVDNTNSSIDKANLVITTNNVTKTYDGTTSAKGKAVATAGTQVFAGDILTGGTFAFADKNAGTGKTVSTAAVTVNDGNGGNNYNVSYADNVNSSINKRLLTISATAVNKVYDGKLTTGTDRPLVTGRQRGDSITGLSQSFLDKNVGTGKTVRVNSGYVVNDGNGGNNYDVVLLADNVNGVITPRTLTISTVANTKVYDGGVTSANKPLVTGLATGDRLTGLYQQYETKLVGENKKMLIKAGYVLKDGNNGANYNVVEQTSNDGVITVH